MARYVFGNCRDMDTAFPTGIASTTSGRQMIAKYDADDGSFIAEIWNQEDETKTYQNKMYKVAGGQGQGPMEVLGDDGNLYIYLFEIGHYAAPSTYVNLGLVYLLVLDQDGTEIDRQLLDHTIFTRVVWSMALSEDCATLYLWAYDNFLYEVDVASGVTTASWDMAELAESFVVRGSSPRTAYWGYGQVVKRYDLDGSAPLSDWTLFTDEDYYLGFPNFEYTNEGFGGNLYLGFTPLSGYVSADGSGTPLQADGYPLLAPSGLDYITRSRKRGRHLWSLASGFGGQYVIKHTASPSVSETVLTIDLRTQYPYVDGNEVGANFYGFLLASDADTFSSQMVTQSFVEVAVDLGALADPPPTVTPCSGNATIGGGTNPAAGTSLATMTKPLAWIEMVIDGTTYRFSDIGIHDANPKEARVLSFGTLSRALSDDRGNVELPHMTVRLSDFDLFFRELGATGLMHNQPFSCFVADLTTVLAGGTPRRQFYGVIRNYKPLPNLEFEISAESWLTFASTAGGGQEKQIPAVLVSSDISDQNPTDKMIDRAVPHIYGACSDEDQAVQVGVVPTNYIASSSDNPLADNLHRFLLCKGAIKQVHSVFLGDYVGGGLEPTVRIKAPGSAYGIPGPLVSVPTQSGALEPYADVNGERYTWLYGEDGHLAIELARSGRIPITVNVCGHEDVGDGSGELIQNPAMVALHALNNLFVQVAQTDWLGIADLGSHTLFDTDAWAAVAAICADRGYVTAGLIGETGQISWRVLIADLCRNGGFDVGENRHGQWIPAMLDRSDTYASARVFTDQSHVIKGSLEIDPCLDDVENEIWSVYRKNYVEALHATNPAVGARPNRDPYDGKWFSGLKKDADEDSINDMGGRPRGLRTSQVQQYNLVRDSATGDDLAAQRKAWKSRPRKTVRFTVTSQDGDGVELGQVIKLTHYQVPWIERRLYVKGILDDVDQYLRTFVCKDVENLLP